MKSCPVCSIPMDEVPKSGVVIDVCPRCKGVWLDRGELTRLMDAVKSYRNEYEQHHNHDHDDRYYQKHGYPHKKKGLFKMLGDIFD